MTPAKPRPLLVPGHVDPLDPVEQLDGQGLALGRRRPGPAWRTSRTYRLGSALTFRAWPRSAWVALFRFLSSKPELHGVIAVALLGPDLEHGARAAFQDGDRHRRAVLLVNLGHADLAPQQSHSHRLTPSLCGTRHPAGMGRDAHRRREVRDAVVHLGKEVRFHARVAARHLGDPGVGAVARRTARGHPIEASDATGRARASEPHAVQETLRPASPRRASRKIRSIRIPRGKP